nr:hypothetical protein [uncultured Acetatifactor sp.]
MKKKLIIVFAVIAVILLLIPVKKVYEDGGTQTYTLLLPVVGGKMEYLQGNISMLQLSPGGMIASLYVGLAGVMILTGISVFPYMKKQVREVLSEMEG